METAATVVEAGISGLARLFTTMKKFLPVLLLIVSPLFLIFGTKLYILMGFEENDNLIALLLITTVIISAVSSLVGSYLFAEAVKTWIERRVK
jgi:hypothetical protein